MPSREISAEIRSRSPDETQRWGRKLARDLQAGDVLALTGPIGSGKTTLVKGIALGLGVPLPSVASPSFVLIREYQGRIPLYHADLFRLEKIPEGEALGLEEYFESQGITVIEWANRIPAVLPQEFLEIQFEVVDSKTRRITIQPRGKSYEERFKTKKGQTPCE